MRISILQFSKPFSEILLLLILPTKGMDRKQSPLSSKMSNKKLSNYDQMMNIVIAMNENPLFYWIYRDNQIENVLPQSTSAHKERNPSRLQYKKERVHSALAVRARFTLGKLSWRKHLSWPTISGSLASRPRHIYISRRRYLLWNLESRRVSWGRSLSV